MNSNMQKSKEKDELIIDLPHIFNVLIKRLWIIAMVSFICAGIGFSVSAFFITPQYSSSAKVLVNNKSGFSIDGASVSLGGLASGDLTAAQNLVDTYMVILRAEDSLEKIIENIGLDMTTNELSGMLSAKQINDTQIFGITVTTDDPYLSQRIAEEITNVLPDRLDSIYDGSCSMEIVDSPRVNLNKVSPSITRYTAVGFLIGALLACGFFAVTAILDDAIHDENYILDNYNFPLLAKIPDLYDSTEAKYASYYSSEKTGGEEAEA